MPPWITYLVYARLWEKVSGSKWFQGYCNVYNNIYGSLLFIAHSLRRSIFYLNIAPLVKAAGVTVSSH